MFWSWIKLSIVINARGERKQASYILRNLNCYFEKTGGIHGGGKRRGKDRNVGRERETGTHTHYELEYFKKSVGHGK